MMNRNACMFCLAGFTLAALAGCSGPSAKDSNKTAIPLDKIQGKAQVLVESGGASGSALNGGGSSSVYLWVGQRRYRLFLRTPVEIVHGNEYVAEGVDAQKAIDEIGDPDQGKNGYPIEASCRRVVLRAWNNLSFDVIDSTVGLVQGTVKRYPARTLFLVTRVRPATAEEATKEPAKSETEDRKIREVSVPAQKQSALLIEGPVIQTAPLWEPAGGTARCKVIIGTNGKIAELETGAQLCEYVQWSQFRYQPPLQAGRPVKVETEVEVRFEPRQ